ncbi:hypothetical protein D9M68_671590 [compost metagenome]
MIQRLFGNVFYDILHHVHADITIHIFSTGFYRRVEHFWPHKIIKESFFDVVSVGYFGREGRRGIATVIALFNEIVKGDIGNKSGLMKHHLSYLNAIHGRITCFGNISCHIGVEF